MQPASHEDKDDKDNDKDNKEDDNDDMEDDKGDMEDILVLSTKDSEDPASFEEDDRNPQPERRQASPTVLKRRGRVPDSSYNYRL